MPGSVEIVATLTLVILALTFPVPTTSYTRQCSPAGSRPHPEGFCGMELARLYQNFCFLLRLEYPNVFAMVKRSADRPARRAAGAGAGSLIIPLSLLAKLEFKPRGNEQNLPALDGAGLSLYSDFYGSEVQDSSPSASFPGLLHMLRRKRSSRQKRDLVCDCCYSACTQARLAQYC